MFKVEAVSFRFIHCFDVYLVVKLNIVNLTECLRRITVLVQTLKQRNSLTSLRRCRQFLFTTITLKLHVNCWYCILGSGLVHCFVAIVVLGKTAMGKITRKNWTVVAKNFILGFDSVRIKFGLFE